MDPTKLRAGALGEVGVLEVSNVLPMACPIPFLQRLG